MIMSRFLFSFTALISLSGLAFSADEPSYKGLTKSQCLTRLKEDTNAINRIEAVAALSLMEPRDRAMTDAVADALLTDKSVRVRLRAVDAAAVILATSKTEERTVADALGK